MDEIRADETIGAGEATAIGVTPAGAGANRLLRDLAAAIAGGREFRVETASSDPGDLVVLEIGRSRSEPSPRLDLLLAAHPALLRRRELAVVRDGGVVILGGTTNGLRLEQLDELEEREIALWRCDTTRLLAAGDGSRSAFVERLGAALLATRPELARRAGLSEPNAAGEALFVPLEIAELREKVGIREESSPSPLLPAPDESADERKSWDRRLRHFHLTGEDRVTPDDPFGNLPLEPAVLEILRQETEEVGAPLVLPVADQESAAVPLVDWLRELASELPLLAPQLGLVSRLVRNELADRGVVDAEEAVRLGLKLLPAELDLSPAAAEQLGAEIARLESCLPGGRSVCVPSARNLLPMFTVEAMLQRRSHRQAFLREVDQLVEQLEDHLKLDLSHSPEGSSPVALGSTLGGAGSDFVDPAALSRNLPEHHGSRRIEPERRERIEGVVARLRAATARARAEAEIHVVCRQAPGESVEDVATLVLDDEPLAAAVRRFDELARRTVELLRDVHLARLESLGVFDPVLHGPVLDRFDRHVLDSRELLLVPAVVVVDRCGLLREDALGTFLRSGRPVSLLLSDSGTLDELDTTRRRDLGYLAVAHREAYVVQSTVAALHHLSAGIRSLARAAIAGVAVVEVRADERARSPGQLLLAHASRVHACFRYDPSAGESWAERFDLSDNPSLESSWLRVETVARDETGTAKRLPEAVTPAHAAAITPALRDQFLVIPVAAWSNRQVEIAAFLELSEGERERNLPFLWVVTPDGLLARAIVTRKLAVLCDDRRRFWRVLQELAGIDNEHVRRAVAEARRSALDEAAREREALVADHLTELERVRNETAGEAMGRLAAVLLNLEELPAGTGTAIPAGEPSPEPSPVAASDAAPAAEPPVEEEEEEEAGFDDPYIDSMLCTTCNECIDLNPKMFRYNDNRQAVLTDPSLGSFAELVRAAEKCPARCIHPGAPRAGDETATEEMLQRAKAFS